jgi:hypothetical protein
MKYSGGCHCGAVRFEVEAGTRVVCQDCNCSICTRSGYVHLIVPKSKFNLVQGSESLSTYRFDSGVAQHHFCKICGIKSFYIPRSNPDGVGVNLRCLDIQPDHVVVEKFDGVNWDENAATLKHLSVE